MKILKILRNGFVKKHENYDVKVKDHCHITGRYRGFVLNKCNDECGTN